MQNTRKKMQMRVDQQTTEQRTITTSLVELKPGPKYMKIIFMIDEGAYQKLNLINIPRENIFDCLGFNHLFLVQITGQLTNHLAYK